jgi:hypothetical protein
MRLRTILCLLTLTTAFYCCRPASKGTVSTAAFYSMSPSYVRTDAAGKNYFQVYAKGLNENECKDNAKLELMKMLIYDGTRQGIALPSILNDPAQVVKFRRSESDFFKTILTNPAILEAGKPVDNSRTLLQSTNNSQPATRLIIVSVNQQALAKQVLDQLNIK